MEYAAGGDLFDRVATNGRLSEDEVCSFTLFGSEILFHFYLLYKNMSGDPISEGSLNTLSSWDSFFMDNFINPTVGLKIFIKYNKFINSKNDLMLYSFTLF